MAKLHELEEAENMTRTVNVAVIDEHRKTGTQGPRRSDRFQFDNRNQHTPHRAMPPQQYSRQPIERKHKNQPVRGKGPSPEVVCFCCQGKGHYVSNPICPMFGKDGGPGRQLCDHPQLKAAQVSDAVGEIGASDDPVDEADAMGEWDKGSQWESGMEGDGSLHSHEDAPHVNRISVMDILSEPEDDDQVYVRAV